MNANVAVLPEPRLAPPGAGLPTIELYIARLMFGWRRLVGNRAAFNAKFQQEREIVRRLVAGCDADTGAQRVLIQRVPGLEDSSRNWSVWMTLDHLRIIHSGMARTIGSLVKGVVPPGRANTARVKPSSEANAAVLAEYEASCDVLLAVVAASPDLKTKARYVHPWFGALDAAGWHALAGGHLQIHRIQLERIIAGLAAKKD